MDAIGVVEVVFNVEFIEVKRDNERGVRWGEERGAEQSECKVGSETDNRLVVCVKRNMEEIT